MDEQAIETALTTIEQAIADIRSQLSSGGQSGDAATAAGAPGEMATPEKTSQNTMKGFFGK
jgi:hypothetical protein